MITVKQMERAWMARQYERLYRDLITFRPEATLKIAFESGWSAPAAAMAIVRMDELCQAHTPLYGKLLRAVLAAQQTDGGWGDLATTALCVRALLCGLGDGIAVEQGLSFLARLQKDNGLWPHGTHRRLPEDAHTSAIVLFHLANQPAFQNAVRFEQLVDWFERNESFLDAPTREVWDRISRRCRFLQAA